MSRLGVPARHSLRRSAGLLLLASLWGCDEEPIRVEDQLWLVEQQSQSLLSLALAEPGCQTRGYLTEQLGPIALDGEERLLAVDVLQRRLVDVQPSDGRITRLIDLPMITNPLALTVTPGNRVYLLDDGTRIVRVDPEDGNWSQTWTLQPEGGWSGLAWLPEAVETANGELLPAGTLLAWRRQGEQGMLAWLELEEGQALAHELFGTPELAGLDTSAGRARIYGLSPTGEIYLLHADLRETQWIQQVPCTPLEVVDIAIP